MTIIRDSFNRSTLGPSWQTPSWDPGTEEVPIEIVSSGVGIAQASAVTDFNYIYPASGQYIGAGELETDQWAEVQIVKEQRADNLSVYEESFAYIAVTLNNKPFSEESAISVRARMSGLFYTYAGYTFEPMYFDIISLAADGAQTFEAYSYPQPADLGLDLPGGDYNGIPAGSKIRLERYDGAYYLYYYNPFSGLYYPVLNFTDNTGLDLTNGYPGVWMASQFKKENMSITNFKAGDAKGSFLTGNTMVGDSSLTRNLVRA